MTRFLSWGALPPPVHGSSLVNTDVKRVMERIGETHWVDAATAVDMSELRKVNARKTLLTFGRMADYLWYSVFWRRRHTAYLSIATVGAALYRDLVIWAVARLASPRVIVHLHSGELSDIVPHGRLAPLQRWLLAASELWVLGNPYVEPMREAGAKLVRVVPNGVICESSHHGEGRRAAGTGAAGTGAAGTGAEGAREQSGDDPVLRVLFLAHHWRTKGTDVVAETAEAMEGEAVSWTLAGTVMEADVEEELAALRRLGDRYRRIEHVDADVRCRLYHESDCLVMPSRYRHEASPLVLLEAMEHGVIPFSSSKGCMPDTVGDVGGVCDSVEEYVEVLRRLMKDPAELAERSAAAVERWRASYSKSAFEERIEGLLSDADGTS